MTYKDLVVRSLKDHKVTPIDSPLGNEFVLDDKWHVEMDRDGAFALAVSSVSNLSSKNQQKGFIVFSTTNNEEDDQVLARIRERIEDEIIRLRKTA